MIGEDLSNKLIYSTVQLECYDEKVVSKGTSFFMTYKFDDKNITVLVTNKHVVCINVNKETLFKKARFQISKEVDDKPQDNDKVIFNIDDLDNRVIFHDDKNVDLCFVLVNDLLNNTQSKGIKLYCLSLETSLIIPNASIEELNPIEDIVMIGYPIGLIDDVNNKPIARRGITATSYKFDYNGKKEFLIDIACFCGSSGSPVFLRRTGLGKEKGENGIIIGMSVQYFLLGVLYAGPTQTFEGKIIIKDIPCVSLPVSETNLMVNLGCVIKACRIMELFEKVKNELNKN